MIGNGNQIIDYQDDIDYIITELDIARENIGEKTDFVNIPFDPSAESILAYLKTGYYHVHGDAFVYPKYADPIELISNAAVWNSTGNKIEVMPANTITKPFDLHWASISDISANLWGIIDIFAGPIGSEVWIGVVDLTRTAVTSQEGNKPVQIPQQPANTRISCTFSDSTNQARTCRVKFYGHTYG